MPQTARNLSIMAGVALGLLCGGLFAEDRMIVEDATLPAGGTGEEILVTIDNDVPVLGFSLAFDYDETVLAVTEVTPEDTLAAGAPVDGFFDGTIDEVSGLVGYGCVVDFDLADPQPIPVGTGQAVTKVLVDVLATGDATTSISLETVTPVDPSAPEQARAVENVLTTEEGWSIKGDDLTLVSGTVTIEDRTPAIVSLSGNEGYAGDVFELVGDFLEEPGLEVTVCDAPAEFELQGDGRTLRITAPACGPPGFAAVEVCTIRGCDVEDEGFDYLLVPAEFMRADTNGDQGIDISDGVRILLYLFAGTVETTCPDAFDADDSGAVEVTDGIRVFTYLFLSGETIPPPFPDPGLDPTEDSLPICQ